MTQSDETDKQQAAEAQTRVRNDDTKNLQQQKIVTNAQNSSVRQTNVTANDVPTATTNDVDLHTTLMNDGTDWNTTTPPNDGITTPTTSSATSRTRTSKTSSRSGPSATTAKGSRPPSGTTGAFTCYQTAATDHEKIRPEKDTNFIKKYKDR